MDTVLVVIPLTVLFTYLLLGRQNQGNNRSEVQAHTSSQRFMPPSTEDANGGAQRATASRRSGHVRMPSAPVASSSTSSPPNAGAEVPMEVDPMEPHEVYHADDRAALVLASPASAPVRAGIAAVPACASPVPAPAAPAPAPARATPAPSRVTPAPSRATPAPSRATAAPSRATPVPFWDRATPAPAFLRDTPAPSALDKRALTRADTPIPSPRVATPIRASPAVLAPIPEDGMPMLLSHCGLLPGAEEEIASSISRAFLPVTQVRSPPSTPVRIKTEPSAGPSRLPTTPVRVMNGAGHSTITPEFHQGNRTPRKNSPSKGGVPPTEWTFNWYDSLSGEALSEPPDFVPKGPIGRLCIGDIYYHRTPYGCQLWLRVADSYDEPPYWLPVSCGYERADGKFLILTRVHKLPSWVVESTYRQWKIAVKKDMERADGKEEQDA